MHCEPQTQEIISNTFNNECLSWLEHYVRQTYIKIHTVEKRVYNYLCQLK